MQPIPEKNRIASIDILRGLAMVIMALDHTRDFFHYYSFQHDTTDLEHTSPAIFFTRWITHFCAPAFVFLSGTSAFLSGQRKSKQELSSFLWKRGLWIIILEISANSVAWTFSLDFTNQNLQVLWAIGISMILLSLLIRLPMSAILLTGLILVSCHNLLDTLHLTGNQAIVFIWSALHEFHVFQFGAFSVCVVYPVIPWIGLMTLSYCFGQLYLPAVSTEARK